MGWCHYYRSGLLILTVDLFCSKSDCLDFFLSPSLSPISCPSVLLHGMMQYEALIIVSALVLSVQPSEPYKLMWRIRTHWTSLSIMVAALKAFIWDAIGTSSGSHVLWFLFPCLLIHPARTSAITMLSKSCGGLQQAFWNPDFPQTSTYSFH